MKMKKLCQRLIICFVLVFFNFSLLAENISDISSIIKSAEEAYKQKNYSKSIELYQKILNQHYESFEIYYNLGNAYFKNNQLGKAILYYEKAKRLNPSDPDLKHNLSIAYNKTIDKIDTKENFFIEITKNNFLNQFNLNVLAYVNIVLAFLTLFVFILFLYHTLYRKLYATLLILLVFANLALYILAYSSQKSQQTSHFAVIIEKQVKVSNEPIPNAVIKFNLHEGTKVKLLQKVDNFYLIRLENGAEGWMDEKSIEII